ncbi:UNVERIFIED_CONTAM: hypothetical protein FKN15_055201 [Acipenser sinensis]
MGFKADIIIWDYSKREIHARLTLHKAKVEALAFSPNDLYLVSLGGQDDGSVVVWNVAKGEAVCGSPASAPSSGNCLTVKFSNNNDAVFITAGNGTSELFATCSKNDIRVWHSDTCKELLRITVPNMTCHAVEFMQDGKSIISAWNDGKIRVFTPESGKLIYAINNAHSMGVTAIAATSDCKKIISGGGEGQIGYWEVFDGSPIRELEGSLSGSINGMDISPDGTHFVTGGDDKLVKVWGYNEGEVTHVGIGHSGSITRIKVCPNARSIISISADGAILRWKYPLLS